MVGYYFLLTLATWRFANMISDDTEWGPFAILYHIRTKSWEIADWVGVGVNCFWCMSFWCAAGIVALFCALGFLSWQEAIFWWPAVSTGAIFVNGFFRQYGMP